jgi:hypothetical protein
MCMPKACVIKHNIPTTVYVLTLTHFQQKCPQTIIQRGYIKWEHFVRCACFGIIWNLIKINKNEEPLRKWKVYVVKCVKYPK